MRSHIAATILQHFNSVLFSNILQRYVNKWAATAQRTHTVRVNFNRWPWLPRSMFRSPCYSQLKNTHDSIHLTSLGVLPSIKWKCWPWPLPLRSDSGWESCPQRNVTLDVTYLIIDYTIRRTCSILAIFGHLLCLTFEVKSRVVILFSAWNYPR